MDPLEADLYAAICREPDLAAYHALADYYRERGLDAAADGVMKAAPTGRRPFAGRGLNVDQPWSWCMGMAADYSRFRSQLAILPRGPLDPDSAFSNLADSWAYLLRPDVTI